jgi:divalent metal cation (Fe/Co/Zn/Cd) transporter
MKQVILQVFSALATTLLFIVVFGITFAVVRQGSPGSAILSSGLISIGILAATWILALCFIAFKLASLRKWITQFILAILLGATVSLALLISGPALMDRSLTVYMLSSISNSPRDEIQLDELATNRWWPAVDQVGKRLDEQQRLGLIKIGSNGDFELTESGKLSVELSRMMQKIFNLEPFMANGS